MNLVTLPEIQVSQVTAGGLDTLVGNTPLLPLQRIGAHVSPAIRLYAKAEWFNPGGSIKDRPALAIIRSALLQNRFALPAVGVLLLFQLAFTYAGPMQHLFGTAALDAMTWLFILLLGSSVFFLVEAEKAILRRWLGQ